jgi:ArsR family transcriptional regulator, arsenate/arsenite/antimonite-responsive transcriptional repressor
MNRQESIAMERELQQHSRSEQSGAEESLQLISALRSQLHIHAPRIRVLTNSTARPAHVDRRSAAAHHFDYSRIIGASMNASRAVVALAALAHEYRLAVFRMLVESGPKGLPAGEIAARLKIPPSSMTFHLQVLQRAGLITQERMSRQLIYEADFAAMNGLVDYLTENCCAGSEFAEACAAKCPSAERPVTSRKVRRTA